MPARAWGFESPPEHQLWPIVMELLIATRNRHKIGEIGAILQLPGLFLLSLDDIPGLPDVEETGRTFEENAILKALTMARHTGRWTMADDSGLEVEALGGAPGVRSARFAGQHGDDHANNRKLLECMKDIRDRRARFRCVLALASPDGVSRTVEGVCEGQIAEEERGVNGFGYDPLFIPEGHACTFAEMDPVEKNRISHRSRALRRAADAWRPWLGADGTGIGRA